jgi:MYXO-CTERM domain-containing protein
MQTDDPATADEDDSACSISAVSAAPASTPILLMIFGLFAVLRRR